MRERGKGVEQFNGESYFMDTSLQLPCKKHPSSSSSSSGGICAFCLRAKLARLVCPQCGEQRLPNCSCTLYSEPKPVEPEILRRSNSISSYATDVNQRSGLWRFRKLFRKKKEKTEFAENPIDNSSKNEPWGYSDVTAVQRSRSLSSFRGGGSIGGAGGGGGSSYFYDNDQDSGYNIHSAARASSVSGGFMMESAKMSCFSESEARMSNFEGRMSNFDYEKDLMNRGIYTMREGYEFSSVEDPKFIDLKLESSSSSEIRNDQPYYRKGYNEFYGGYNGGESCRYSVSENELKKCRKSRKGWKWPFKASGKDKG